MTEGILTPDATLEQVNSLLRAMREMGAMLLTARDERTLLDYTNGRLLQALDMPFGAIFLSDGERITVATTAGSPKDGSSPLPTLLGRIPRLLQGGAANDVQVLAAPSANPLLQSDAEIDLSAMQSLGTLVLIPLFSHGAPMGVLACATPATRTFAPTTLRLLRLLGQLVTGGVRELRLQAKIDVISRRLATESVHESDLDVVTGLGNRQFALEQMHQHVAEAIKTGDQLSVLLVEVDHYDGLCANLGDKAAASVLANIAKTAQGTLRGKDMAVRFNDAVIGILLPSTPGIGAVVVAERLRDRIAAMDIAGKAKAWHVTASIGVACLSNVITTSNALIAKAESALMQAQPLGGNQVIFDWDEALEPVED